jgi:hypothetical protein
MVYTIHWSKQVAFVWGKLTIPRIPFTGRCMDRVIYKDMNER